MTFETTLNLSLADFRSKVLTQEEIREADVGEDLVSFCYMISSSDTFNTPESRECRGIVFNSKTGKVVGRPLHKFFNLNEREETLVTNLDWGNVSRVMDKRDGSMIHTVLMPDGSVKLKSKKSFESDVAKAAQKFFDADPNFAEFAKYLKFYDATAIFEYTAPDSRIVLWYEEPSLTLLTVRNNKTGEYSNFSEIDWISRKFGIPKVEQILEFYDEVSWKFDVMKMMEAAKTREGIEGWVVQFENGDMIKVKTDWYLKRHHAITFVRERDIAQLVVDEGIDDMKSMLVGFGIEVSEIIEIEDRVAHIFASLMKTVEEIYEQDKHLTVKEFAIKYKEHEYSGLLMSKYNGKEPKYKQFFERNYLKQNFSLRHLQMVPSKAEN